METKEITAWGMNTWTKDTSPWGDSLPMLMRQAIGKERKE